MKTVKYDTHNIKTLSGKFIVNEHEWKAIKDMMNAGKDKAEINGQMVSIYSDKIETVGNKLHRTTTVTVGAVNEPV